MKNDLLNHATKHNKDIPTKELDQAGLLQLDDTK